MRRSIKVGALAIALTAVLMSSGSGNASIPGSGSWDCGGSGTVTIAPLGNDRYGWTLTFPDIACTNTPFGTLDGSLVGSGTSRGLGFCSPGHVVSNLDIEAHYRLQNSPFGDFPIPVEFEGTTHFRADQTTFPVITPFKWGRIITRVTGKCPPGGSDSATLQFFL